MNALSVGTSSSYISAALAQQQVLGDQAQLQRDQALLRQDQAQLDKDSARAFTAQQQSQRIQQNVVSQAQKAGTDQLAQKAQAAQASQPAPAVQNLQALQSIQIPVQSTQATVNTSGQTVGKIINVVA